VIIIYLVQLVIVLSFELVMLYAMFAMVWLFLSDYADYVFSRKAPTTPPDWSVLMKGQIPRASEAEIDKQKEHLAHSCEVHGYHVQRNTPYALIGRPLQMDE